MKRKLWTIALAGLWISTASGAQNPPSRKAPAAVPQAAHQLAAALAQRLGTELNVRTSVGEPVKAGAVTLIPIIMVDVGFGGGGMAFPAGGRGETAGQPTPEGQPGPQAKPAMGAADGFFMSGEARPLGFVAVTRTGTRFIGVGKTPAK